MRLSRANRGNRLKELIAEGFSDEDEITDDWKDAADDQDASVASCSDDSDSDFSASEHSSTMSGASKASWGSDKKHKAKAAPMKELRKRKPPKIPQSERLKSALLHALRPDEISDIGTRRGPQRRQMSERKQLVFYSGPKTMPTAVMVVQQ